jgi:hypothetical protein
MDVRGITTRFQKLHIRILNGNIEKVTLIEDYSVSVDESCRR